MPYFISHAYTKLDWTTKPKQVSLRCLIDQDSTAYVWKDLSRVSEIFISIDVGELFVINPIKQGHVLWQDLLSLS